MSDNEDEHEEEDHEAFADWLLRPIGDATLNDLSRFTGASVPDREPTGTNPWLPRGPTGIGGRVRALALDPEPDANGRPRSILAGAASGGVFRSLDHGRSWSSVWEHSKPTSAIGALAAGRVSGGAEANRRYFWAATGEPGRVPGTGVYRARLDSGATFPMQFEQVGTLAELAPGVAAAERPISFEAAAVDPSNPRVCWFVGAKGVFRYSPHFGGPAGNVETDPYRWSRFTIPTPAGAFRSGGGVDDVKFVQTTYGRYVVLAVQNSAWGDLILIPAPDASDADIQAVIDAAVLGGAAPGAVTIGANLASPALAAGATLPLADPARRCSNVRIAIVPAVPPAVGPTGPDRVYAIYATRTEDGGEVRNPFHQLRRSDCIAGAPVAWTVTSNWDQPIVGAVPQVDRQNQGDYNLVLLAAPGGAGGDQVIWGMIDVYVSGDSGAHFTMSVDWLRYDQGDRGQHADQHALALAPVTAPPGARPTLWLGNDGGVAYSDRYLDAAGAPRPAETSGWRRSIAGLVIGQTYDLSQSPVLPDACAIALQDLGGWMDGGGGHWRHIQGGDGMGVAFDPHDPHHLIACWQGSNDVPLRGCDDVRFEGAMDLGADRVFTNGAWHRALNRGVVPHRVLARGLAPADRSTFEDTVLHPTHPGHIAHIRERRLYMTADGERWRVQPVGDRIELLVQLTVPAHPAHPAPPPPPPPLPLQLAGVMLRVGGPAAINLGFHLGETSDLRSTSGSPQGAQVYRLRVVSTLATPTLAPNEELHLELEIATGSTTAPARFRRELVIRFPDASYTYAEALARMRTSLNGPLTGNWQSVTGAGAQPLPAGVVVEIHALPTVGSWPASVEIVSEATGSNVDITVGPAAGAEAASKLLVQRRPYRGDTDRPAVVTLQGTNYDPATDHPPGPVAASDALELAAHRTITVLGASVTGPLGDAITFTFPDSPAFSSYGRPLALALRDAQGTGASRAQVRIWPVNGRKWVRLRAGRAAVAAFTPFQVNAASTALAGLTAGATVAPTVDQVLIDLRPQLRGRYDLGGAAGSRRLTIDIGGTAHHIDFAPADFGGGLRALTVEEVRREIERQLNPAAAPTDVVVEVQRDQEVQHVYEVAYSPANPEVIWVGALNHLWVTLDGGATWRELFPQPNGERGRNWNNFINVEAIAPDPFPPSDLANGPYTALVGIRGGGWNALYRASATASGGEVTALDSLSRPSDYEDSGGPLRVYAIEGDPRRRDTYYAATEIGVYRSTDNGGGWSAFSVGLPHVPTLDLALDRATDTLRVAVFGRGLYERYLGDGAAPLPASVYLRANTRDAGRRPVVHGPELSGDTPRWVDAVRSPDIRLTSMPSDAVRRLDAVELDDVPSEPARRDTTYQLAIRVHNRGAAAIGDARVIALWADASTGLPALEDEFWNLVGSGTVPLGAITVGSGASRWRVIGDERGISLDAGGTQRVILEHTWSTPALPATNPLDGASQVALLAIVTRGDARLDPPRNDVGGLLLHDARVAVRLADVRGADGGAIRISAIVPDTTTPIGGNLPGLEWVQLSGGPAPAMPSALELVALGGAFPAPVAITSAAGPWTAEARTLRVERRERYPVPRPTHAEGGAAPAVPAPALDVDTTTVTIALDHGGFATPASVTAPEMRAYLQRRLSRETRLFHLDAADFDLALRRSELVVTAAGTAATDADFALLALARAADVAIGAAQRFSVRVWNDGDTATVLDEARFFWLDPHAAGAPTPAAIDVPQAVVSAPGRSTIISVEGTIPAISGADVLILADVHALGTTPPAPTFADWDAVIAWASRTHNTVARMFRRR